MTVTEDTTKTRTQEEGESAEALSEPLWTRRVYQPKLRDGDHHGVIV
ncbi:hypothetical protein [Haloarchaeobius sp. DFWS5]